MLFVQVPHFWLWLLLLRSESCYWVLWSTARSMRSAIWALSIRVRFPGFFIPNFGIQLGAPGSHPSLRWGFWGLLCNLQALMAGFISAFGGASDTLTWWSFLFEPSLPRFQISFQWPCGFHLSSSCIPQFLSWVPSSPAWCGLFFIPQLWFFLTSVDFLLVHVGRTVSWSLIAAFHRWISHRS